MLCGRKRDIYKTKAHTRSLAAALYHGQNPCRPRVIKRHGSFLKSRETPVLPTACRLTHLVSLYMGRSRFGNDHEPASSQQTFLQAHAESTLACADVCRYLMRCIGGWGSSRRDGKCFFSVSKPAVSGEATSLLASERVQGYLRTLLKGRIGRWYVLLTQRTLM